VAQNKLSHKTICNIPATSGLTFKKILKLLSTDIYCYRPTWTPFKMFV